MCEGTVLPIRDSSGLLSPEAISTSPLSIDQQWIDVERRIELGNKWAPGKLAKFQCDISCMISPEMFNEFVLPYLEEQCKHLNYSFYHLDGPGAIKHLNSLLSIEELDGIQWTPGIDQDGLESPKWFPIYHKILSRGKKLWFLGLPKNSIKEILKELSPKRTLYYYPLFK
ncbi:MAG: hypothetical protein NC905_06510 [Candidatus Omnitrophica bacterium]|nr:hypothetical protein [Candidatus Omnitrophota bacterium]